MHVHARVSFGSLQEVCTRGGHRIAFFLLLAILEWNPARSTSSFFLFSSFSFCIRHTINYTCTVLRCVFSCFHWFFFIRSIFVSTTEATSGGSVRQSIKQSAERGKSQVYLVCLFARAKLNDMRRRTRLLVYCTVDTQ